MPTSNRTSRSNAIVLIIFRDYFVFNNDDWIGAIGFSRQIIKSFLLCVRLVVRIAHEILFLFLFRSPFYGDQMRHNDVAWTMFYAAVVQVPTIEFSLIGLQSSSFFFPLLLSKGCSISTDCGALKLRQASIKAQNPCNITSRSKRATKIVLSCLDND